MASEANITTGNYQCPHGINTDDVNEWNEHCLDPANGHTDSGTTLCTDCGATIVFQDIPFQKILPGNTKNISMKCPECKDNTDNIYNNNQVVKIKNPDKGYRMLQPHEKAQQQQESQQ